MASTFIDAPINPARVCFAIAHIGYIPSAAIMDIVDNSVSADANNILIEMVLNPDKNFSQKNNVTAFRIYDNGLGMDEIGIQNALALGSSSDYKANSLSKFGMGLKSAGFSLGNRITVVSKQCGQYSSKFTLDYDIISTHGKYVIEVDAIDSDTLSLLDVYFADNESGTFIEVSNCKYEDQHSMRKVVEDLWNKLGVVYYERFVDQEHEFSIKISCAGTNKGPYVIEPIDMLFWDIALDEFDPDTYSGKLPCKVLDKTIDVSGTDIPIRIRAAVFPKDKMSNYFGFTPEEKQQINKYQIKTDNKGFFIYRNGRLIRWGDSLGLVSKDKYGFRAAISITEAHDDALHVDVSKQRISLPEDFLMDLKRLITKPLNESAAAFEVCSRMANESGPTEGSEFDKKNIDLTPEDPDESTATIDKTKSKERRQKLIEAAAEAEQDDIGDTPVEATAHEQETAAPEVFQRIRYSDKISGNVLYEAHENPTDGVFIRINKLHYYYETVLSRLIDNESTKQAIEALLWAAGAAEVLTQKNLTSVSDADLDSVLKKFKKLLSYNLASWCEINQDLINGS